MKRIYFFLYVVLAYVKALTDNALSFLHSKGDRIGSPHECGTGYDSENHRKTYGYPMYKDLKKCFFHPNW